MPPLDRDGLLLAIGKAVVDHLRDGRGTFTNDPVTGERTPQDEVNAAVIEQIMEQFGPLPGFTSAYQDKIDAVKDYGLPRRVIDGKPEDIKDKP